MFKLKPNTGLLCTALFVFISGGLISAYLFDRDVYLDSSNSGSFAILVTGILTTFLLIAATSRMWFRHLWHHRPGYKRG